MLIGEKIKSLRLVAGLTQEELASRLEYSKGFISQVENDIVNLTVPALSNMLEVLGTNLKDFFSDEVDSIVFHRRDHYIKEEENSTTAWLVPSAQKNQLEPILFTLKAGAISTQDLPHEGEEFGYVLQGKIRLVVGKRKYKLDAGDSFYFKADKTHFLENLLDTEARILWISTPPNF
ncbi:MAG: cupin domain-containing protein [Firmicutes bacterium]|nr:cupin domain-containing protein [Bacillota bacterium]